MWHVAVCMLAASTAALAPAHTLPVTGSVGFPVLLRLLSSRNLGYAKSL